MVPDFIELGLARGDLSRAQFQGDWLRFYESLSRRYLHNLLVRDLELARVSLEKSSPEETVKLQAECRKLRQIIAVLDERSQSERLEDLLKHMKNG